MRAVILCAGQGRRLMPLTETRPKCLLPVAGMPVLEWQLRGLAANGITDVTVVTGFGAGRVDEMLAGLGSFAARVRARFNPFFAVADNIGSCFLARDVLESGSREDGCVLLNGDTLFEPAILTRLLQAPQVPITVTIDRKPHYDDDDMKVSLEGTRLRAIGKTLPPERTHGESIGMLLFRGEGGTQFTAGVEAVMRQPEGLKRWYLSVIDALAAKTEVRVASIEGLSWGEIDFPADVMRAELLGQRWRQAGLAPAAAE
ncbi:phosphocholine cytidylyltransferase family protein [Roseomonas ludipueritiae]|uniref:Phosphocholine cytidylyltransferase family protein n=1 Tax=Pseudoroseomonas ludipueritiae TaxID=198093 RepID=A0ABR7R3Q2_9PROT|nr:phosphocholine cytidylyltransferase family protein [Pseudoroseomonas ludipueritiae]MBC9176392.1 phosphocholine cytidylyltransferase family protein [Pseudoroseomonas ludipueritiae]